MGIWHYERNGERHGPVSDSDLEELISRRAVDAQTLVWKQGLPGWVPLSDTPLAAQLRVVSEPPPLPGSRIRNELVWILAFAPLIGVMLQAFCAGLVYGPDSPESDDRKFWWVTVILNIALSMADARRLKRAGVDVQRIDRLAFLVPIYLWKRQKTLGQHFAVFWVWIVTFVLVLFL